MKFWPHLLAGLAALGVAATIEPQRQNQAYEYNADAPKTILELQQFRHSNSARIASRDGRQGVAALVDLNPQIGAWFLLKIAWAGAAEVSYHLENPKPEAQRLLLDTNALVILAGKHRYACDLFGGDVLVQAKASRSIFAPLCEGRIYMRNPAMGYRTTLESATEFLRERVWGGEKIIELGHVLMGDAHRETGTVRPNTPQAGAGAGPVAALIDEAFRGRTLAANNLGIDLGGEKARMAPGAWYAAAGHPGVFVSVIQPNLIRPEILQSYKTAVSNLDSLEGAALCYLIAFDVDQFELGFALGTEHPAVGWSDRVPQTVRNPKLPGPDGIGSIAPLVSTGLINPENARRTVATFTAGFKRTHGAFKYGELSLENHGSHYGFIENGVVFSKLQPGLATIFALDDGSIQMKTWADVDNALLARIKHARQNGVPLVEFDQAGQATMPGSLVTRWGSGNWSGSQDARLRTIRSGAALQRSNGKRFLIYAVFSSATPSAMVRVFQAYRCDYAMLLDMNALEHTYCALYRRNGPNLAIDHLIQGMSEVDKRALSGEALPRFLAYPDNRDFFYIQRRQSREANR